MAETRLHHVLWLGGMSGVGKTTAARAIARRHDLRLYSLDARTLAHAAELPHDSRTLDEIWVDSTPDRLADWFEQVAEQRFPLVMRDLRGLPDDAPVIVDGPQLLPQLVARVISSPAQALFVVAQPELQRRLVTQRGSLTYAQTRDPAGAQANRLRRDEILSTRVRTSANAHSLSVVEIADVTQAEPTVAEHFAPSLRQWLAREDRGDVAARRREENDARLRQWRAYANDVPDAASEEVPFACECNRLGCAETVTLTRADTETRRAKGVRLLADGHA